MTTKSKALHHPGTFVRESVIPAVCRLKTPPNCSASAGRPCRTSLTGNPPCHPKWRLGSRRHSAPIESGCSICRSPVTGRCGVPVKRRWRGPRLRCVFSDYQGKAAPRIGRMARIECSHSPSRLSAEAGALYRHDLRQVDFPGYDNAQRKGSDGFVEAGAATPWVPEGTSYWELGPDQDSGAKAEQSDYFVGSSTVDPAERVNSTFVSVTPRNWPGKSDWEKRKTRLATGRSSGLSMLSDLEQWLSSLCLRRSGLPNKSLYRSAAMKRWSRHGGAGQTLVSPS